LEEILLSEIATWCNKETSLTCSIKTISTDSRVVDENTLFVALKGERFDANDFVCDVLEKGAKAVVCSRYDGESDRVILVEDTGKALLQIAKGYREKFEIPFVALTGSVGKTTTKGMVHAVLSEKYNTLKTQGNLNNEIGVPKTLFCLENSHEAAVIEMGMNHFDEIS
jgi:UDP-N-acetylmuramoyl-tripeptide--D-alanyl-D-alanine ligase